MALISNGVTVELESFIGNQPSASRDYFLLLSPVGDAAVTTRRFGGVEVWFSFVESGSARVAQVLYYPVWNTATYILLPVEYAGASLFFIGKWKLPNYSWQFRNTA